MRKKSVTWIEYITGPGYISQYSQWPNNCVRSMHQLKPSPSFYCGKVLIFTSNALITTKQTKIWVLARCLSLTSIYLIDIDHYSASAPFLLYFSGALVTGAKRRKRPVNLAFFRLWDLSGAEIVIIKALKYNKIIRHSRPIISPPPPSLPERHTHEVINICKVNNSNIFTILLRLPLAEPHPLT